MAAQPLREQALRGPLRGHRAVDRQHAAGRAAASVPEARREDLGEVRVAQPDRLGQGPRREGADRGRRGERRGRARADDPRTDLRQHRDLAGDDLLAEGLQAEGGDAGERHARAHAAVEDVRRGDRLLRGLARLQRGGREGPADGRRGLLGLHALPVRQPGQPERPLQRHGAGDPRGARRGHRVRRGARHRRHADGQRAAAEGDVRRRRARSSPRSRCRASRCRGCARSTTASSRRSSTSRCSTGRSS